MRVRTSAPLRRRRKIGRSRRDWAGKIPARPTSASLRRGAAHRGLAIHHHIPSWYQCSRAVDLDDHAAKADMDAHGAMKPIREDGGRIGDMPPMRLDCATGLTPQGRKRPRSIWPCGQNLIREVLMQAYSDLRQDLPPLAQCERNPRSGNRSAFRFGKAEGGGQVMVVL